MRALHTAATGMMAQELNVQVISNNIANMRTTGYKKQRAEFQDLLYEQVKRVGTQTSDQGNMLPVGIEIGSGVRTAGTPRVMSQGNTAADAERPRRRHPRRRLLQDQMPDGRTAYTRDGSFELDAQGRLVTAQGYVVLPGITVPQNSTGITINAQGQVSVTPGRHHDADPGRPDRTRAASSTRPACNRSATTSSSKPRLRHGAERHRRARRRLRRPAAGQSRTGQCRSGVGNLRPDRRAARLRDERQGHQRRRPDAAIDHQHVPLRIDDDDRARSFSPRCFVRLARAAPLSRSRRRRARRTAGAARQRHRSRRRRRAHRRLRRECRRAAQIADVPRARPRHHRHRADGACSRRCARIR